MIPFKKQYVYQFDNREMAPLCWFELAVSELLEIEPEASQLLKKIGWGYLFRMFNGHHSKVTRQFALSLKGNVAQIDDLCLVIS